MSDAPLHDRAVFANGLAHHALEHPGAGRGDVLLLHGYLDLARSFTRVIAALGAAGYRVLAPDFRGHGDTDRAPEGSYYHFPDYLADVVGLLDALAVGPAHVVAHSMGGSVATMLAGAFPARVRSLSLLEGIGPPPMPAEVAPDRTARWIEGVARVRARGARRMASLDEVVLRMRVSHPDLPEALLRDAAAVAARPTEDGGYVFRFDPLHQTMSPGRFDADGFEAFIERLTCPVLHVWGQDPAHFPEYSQRTTRYRGARVVELPGAGHMMHWTRPDEVAAAVLGFLKDVEEGDGLAGQ